MIVIPVLVTMGCRVKSNAILGTIRSEVAIGRVLAVAVRAAF